ncbi:MAG TPA: SulP family inorganic anion transporter [Gemmatimonadales bacterium]|nr:SulP family inorganic anion transporter [Gemmatimonadales bacterium]
MLVPKLVTTLNAGYTRSQFLSDLGAGVVVGIVALPLAIAFAIASGVGPERGLYTAIIAGFLISVLGGSRVQIGGPTGAFVVIVAGIVAQHGVAGLTVATLMAGLMLLGLGLAKLGGVIKFIPHPIVTGFTSGIAVIIFSAQIRDLLGLDLTEVPSEFFSKWGAYFTALPTADLPAIATAAVTLAILLLWPRVSHRVPAPFVALLAVTLGAALLHLPVETIAARFGQLDFSLPAPSLPTINEAMVVSLVGPAITIALLGAIESLLSAVVADGMIGGRHRSNMELVAQGVANVVTPIFGGIPATGAIARTATNVKNGGRTPVAGIVHAVTLLLITLFAGAWAGRIPLAVLAAILVVVAYNMSEWRTFVSEIRTAPRSDSAVMLVTFLLTVIVDLTVALAVGMVLASFLFMKRMAEVSTVQPISREMLEQENGEERSEEATQKWRGLVPRGVEVYDVNGPFFFGAAETFGEYLRQVSSKPKSIVLDLEGVPAMDSTGLRALTTLVERRQKEGIPVFLVGLQDQPRDLILRSRLADLLGRERLDLSAEEAVEMIRNQGLMLTSREHRAAVDGDGG